MSGGRAIAVRDGVGVYGDEESSVEYLMYIEKPGPVEVAVEDHGYDVFWINPATGERIVAKGYKGKSFAGEPPDKSHDWLLHISREGHKQGLSKYKFESRRILVQTPETNPNSIPFEIEAPMGDISMKSAVAVFAEDIAGDAGDSGRADCVDGGTDHRCRRRPRGRRRQRRHAALACVVRRQTACCAQRARVNSERQRQGLRD